MTLDDLYGYMSLAAAPALLWIVFRRPSVPRGPEPPKLPPTPDEVRAREVASRWLEENGLAHGVNDPVYRESLVRALMEMRRG